MARAAADYVVLKTPTEAPEAHGVGGDIADDPLGRCGARRRDGAFTPGSRGRGWLGLGAPAGGERERRQHRQGGEPQ
jgi:hypothetical protein